MIEDLITIIVPVYNAESYIEECLRSILNQTYRNFELILVEDGSNDNCSSICDEWAEKDKRIKVVHQKNAGVSVARNVGLDESNGDWIVFIDADDTIEDIAIEEALKIAQDMDCDTVCWNCYKMKDGIITKSPSITPELSMYHGKKMISNLIESLYDTRRDNFYPGYMFRAVWGKLLSAKIIQQNNIRFPVGQPLGEDALFLVDYFQVSKSILLVNNYWTYYRIVSSSAVRQYRNNLLDLQIEELKLLCKKIETTNIDIETVLLNLYLQFEYQYMHHLCQKEKNYLVIFKLMLNYIKNRNYEWKKICVYDKRKIHKKSIPIAWFMVHKCICIEALLCMVRELTHKK